MRSVSVVLAALFVFTLAASPALARPFDLIYADQADVTLCDGCGITLGYHGHAILVNTGPTPITVAEMQAVHFNVSASVPGFRLSPFLNVWGVTFTDLAPGQARGPGEPFFLPLLLPGETLEDTLEPQYQFLAFGIDRDPGTTYEGPVNFHITMEMVDGWLEYDVLMQMRLGQHDIAFTHATRQSATSPPVPARKSTWGALKSLYR